MHTQLKDVQLNDKVVDKLMKKPYHLDNAKDLMYINAMNWAYRIKPFSSFDGLILTDIDNIAINIFVHHYKRAAQSLDFSLSSWTSPLIWKITLPSEDQKGNIDLTSRRLPSTTEEGPIDAPEKELEPSSRLTWSQPRTNSQKENVSLECGGLLCSMDKKRDSN